MVTYPCGTGRECEAEAVKPGPSYDEWNEFCLVVSFDSTVVRCPFRIPLYKFTVTVVGDSLLVTIYVKVMMWNRKISIPKMGCIFCETQVLSIQHLCKIIVS